MIVWLAKRYLHRNLEAGTPLPKWVQRTIARDPQLRDYYAALKEIEDSLQATANGWADEIAADQPRRPTLSLPSIDQPKFGISEWLQPTKLAWSLSLCVVVLAFGLLAYQKGAWSNRQRVVSELPEKVVDPKVAEEVLKREVKAIQATTRESHRLLNRLSTKARKLEETILAPPQSLVATTNRDWTGPTHQLGKWASRWESGVNREQDRLLSDIKSSLRYFSYTLPHRFLDLKISDGL